MKSGSLVSKSALLFVPLTLAACSSTSSTTHLALGDTEAPPSPLGSADGEITSSTESTAATATEASASTKDPASAGLLETLLANGALNEAEYERLKGAEPAPAPAAKDDSASVTIGSGGFRAKSADGESSIKVGGRVQVDGNLHTEDGVPDDAITDGTELRRARIEMQGTLPNDVVWAAEVDFANNVSRIKDFWVGRKTKNGPGVYFGNQKQPFSLEVEMSSNDIPFVERGVDVFLLAPFVDRAVGLRLQDNTESIFYAVGLYGESVSPVPTDVSLDDEGWGMTGRFVAAPIQEDDQVLHLGARASYREPQTTVGLLIRDETTNMSNLRVVSTGLIPEVDSVFLYGPEASYALGPWSVTGEYTTALVARDGDDYQFDGWHLETTYSLTGESRAKAYRINAGEYKRLKAEGDRAWEIAARVANLDLNSGALSGGEEDVASLALNCYYSENVRLMFNWSHIMDTSGGSAITAAAEGLDFFTIRAQLNF